MPSFQFTQRPNAPDPETLHRWLDIIFRNPRYGTWTPTITFATPGDLSVVYSTQNGRYYKFGMIVLLEWNIVTSTFTHTTASGNLRLTGLPFTSVGYGGSLRSGFGNTDWGGIIKANYTDICPFTSENNTIINFAASGSGQTPATIATGDMPTGGTVRLRGNFIYPAFD